MKTLNKKDLQQTWPTPMFFLFAARDLDTIIGARYGNCCRIAVECDSLLKICDINLGIFRDEIYENIKQK